MHILLTKEFEELFQQLPEAIKRRAEKQTDLFRGNPLHPSLRTEKLHPKNRELWSLRVDRTYRILFRFTEKDTALFLAIGHHSWIYRF